MNYSEKKTIHDIDVKEKKVLVRCDFNVPLDEDKNITDPKRIKSSLRTIRYLITNQAKVILCSHLGRPKGKFNKNFSLKPVAEYLSCKLGLKVKLAEDVVGESAKKIVSSLNCGEVALLENLRFHEEETQNDPTFAQKLASLADVYIDDAFGVCHRAHASTVGVTKYLPSAIGFLVEHELSVMGNALKSPERPFVAILGGAKVSDKINVISRLLEIVDTLIVGGGMSYTFTNALGYSVGTSICETDKVDLAKDMMAKAKENDVKLILPIDNKVGSEFDSDTEVKVVDADQIPDGWMGLDIGPKTEEIFSEAIKKARTIIWNGPMGVFEWKNFSHGTKTVAEAVAESDAVSIIGGGDSSAAIELFGLSDKVTHVSTGGGASLQFLEGRPLPGIDAIDDKI